MFGLTFSFSAILWALPLASLPVVLHLLFRRKSPIVLFSTIRFIQASVQRTAARKRVQKWLLLSLRVLLLALLIAAVAQPVKQFTSGWAAPGTSSIAAIVVDTSYSMQLLDHQEPLINKADAAVRELLRAQLANAKVAIFRSPPPPAGQPERLRSAADLLGQWTPLAPEANPRPLVDRVASAADLLSREHADDKWLVVITDFQKHEFPHPLPQPKDAHVVLIDLHPDDPRSAGITRVAIEPAQPTPGIDSEAIVDISGKANTSRPVSVTVNTAAGAKLAATPVQVASLDSAGHARLRFRVRLPAQRWMLLKASFGDEDDMPWDNSRAQLIDTPPRQVVSFLGNRPSPGQMPYATWIALDPSEGAAAGAWSLQVRAGAELAPDANAAVLLAEDWPDDARAARLLSFVRGGGTLILFVRPGLEETWSKLPQSRRNALAALLPSEPGSAIAAGVAPINTVSAVAQADPLLAGLGQDPWHGIIVRRLVPFASEPIGTTLLKCFPLDPRPGLRPQGLLYRRSVDNGVVYTIATLPDHQLNYTNFDLYPPFLPLLVRMAQRPAARGDAQNIELGEPVTLAGKQYEALDSVTIQGPQNDTTVVRADHAGAAVQFPFGPAASPGLYTWLKPGANEPLAMTNVQLPASESELYYTPAATLTDPADNVMIARSVTELTSKVKSLSEPEPQWAGPIAIVLLLLCVEALMGSLTNIGKPISVKGFIPKAPAGM